MRLTVRRWAVAPVAVGLAVVLLVLVGGVRLTRASGPVAGVTATAQGAGFTLRLSVDRARYAANEPISARATLTDAGQVSVTALGPGSSLVGFSVAQEGGKLKAPAVFEAPCYPYTFDPGRPVTFPFRKSGSAEGATGPEAAFLRTYLAGPQLRLPAGTWELSATTSFFIGSCTTEPIDLTASVRIVVGASAP